ncbi:unnamed protein product [Durusdinium trenchii]|uniref:Pentatricopeptide repeat-containing protein n=1 Tax=Durusdinium trenchii TaxID=1381693 RepID=A0ABP0S2R2_9DINO
MAKLEMAHLPLLEAARSPEKLSPAGLYGVEEGRAIQRGTADEGPLSPCFLFRQDRTAILNKGRSDEKSWALFFVNYSTALKISLWAAAGAWLQGPYRDGLTFDESGRARPQPMEKMEVGVMEVNLQLRACGTWLEAKGLLKSMRKIQLKPDVISYGSCINAAHRGGGWLQASHFLQELQEEGLRANLIIYNSLMKSLKHWQKCFDLLSSIHTTQLCPDCLTLTQPLQCLTSPGRGPARPSGLRCFWAESLDVLASAAAMGVEADVLCFNLALGGLVRVQCWQRALRMLRGRRCRPNVVSYNTLLASLPGQEDKLLLLTLMREDMLQPDLVSYNSLMSSYVSSSHWSLALQLLSALPAEKLLPDVVTFTSAINASGEGSQWEVALLLFTGRGWRPCHVGRSAGTASPTPRQQLQPHGFRSCS